METKNSLTLQEAELYFAKTLNGEVHHLLSKTDRSKQDNENMLYAAFGSAYHWQNSGTEINHQRAEWLISHVYTVLNDKTNALAHAERCLEISNQIPDQMQDFDWGYMYECMARALALQNRTNEASEYFQKALSAGFSIKDKEDKDIFMQDLLGGIWYELDISSSID